MTRLLCLAILATLIAGPGAAWRYAPKGDLCRLLHDEPQARVTVTYDPRADLYAIAIERYMATWPEAPVFSIAFEGARGLTISTDRHVLSKGRAAVTVTDTGFGNVLDGIEFNSHATARLGPESVRVDLDGAAPEVAKFRACTEQLTA